VPALIKVTDGTQLRSRPTNTTPWVVFSAWFARRLAANLLLLLLVLGCLLVVHRRLLTPSRPHCLTTIGAATVRMHLTIYSGGGALKGGEVLGMPATPALTFAGSEYPSTPMPVLADTSSP
jgi:hypothetical protein